MEFLTYQQVKASKWERYLTQIFKGLENNSQYNNTSEVIHAI